jgi:hypothetical protein
MVSFYPASDWLIHDLTYKVRLRLRPGGCGVNDDAQLLNEDGVEGCCTALLVKEDINGKCSPPSCSNDFRFRFFSFAVSLDIPNFTRIGQLFGTIIMPLNFMMESQSCGSPMTRMLMQGFSHQDAVHCLASHLSFSDSRQGSH